MPWIAEYEGETVAPREVPSGEDVTCPTCGNTMRVWRESSDGKARHFKHLGKIGKAEGEGGGGTACESVAESNKHKKWKSLAADRLEQLFEGNVAECRMERELGAPVSEKDRRNGDAVMEFESRDDQLGDGVVIEVQHRNESKDILETTSDYAEQGFAVVWTGADDYLVDRCRLTEADVRKRARDAVWPQEVPEQEEWWGVSAFDRIQDGWTSGEPSKEVPAEIVKDWVLPTPAEQWANTPWSARFRGTEGYSTTDDTFRSNHTVIPVVEWLLDDTGTGHYREELKKAHAAGIALREDQLPAVCPHCEMLELHRPLSRGEVGRGSICGNCGEGYDVIENAV